MLNTEPLRGSSSFVAIVIVAVPSRRCPRGNIPQTTHQLLPSLLSSRPPARRTASHTAAFLLPLCPGVWGDARSCGLPPPHTPVQAFGLLPCGLRQPRLPLPAPWPLRPGDGSQRAHTARIYRCSRSPGGGTAMHKTSTCGPQRISMPSQWFLRASRAFFRQREPRRFSRREAAVIPMLTERAGWKAGDGGSCR